MKLVNTYPVKSMSGTIRPDNKMNLYPARGQQIARAYAHPPEPYNQTFRDSSDIIYQIKIAYNAMTPEQKTYWYLFAEYLNTKGQYEVVPWTAWTIFQAVNYYRIVDEVGITIIPPTYQTNKNIDHFWACGYHHDLGMALLAFRVSNLPEEHYKAVFYITDPHKGFLHAYRSCERRLLFGLNKMSIIDIPHTDDWVQLQITEEAEQWETGAWCWLSCRLLTNEYLPLRKERYQLLWGGTMMIYSYGTVVRGFDALQLGALSIPETPGEKGWYRSVDAGQEKLITHADGAIKRFYFPWPPIEIYSQIKITWAGAVGTGSMILRIIKRDDSTPDHVETVLSEKEEICSGTEKQTIFEWESPPFTTEGFVYCVECQTNNPVFDLMRIICLQFTSNVRSF